MIEKQKKNVTRSDPEEGEKVIGDDAWDKTPSEDGNSSDESSTSGESEVKTFTLSDDMDEVMHPMAVVWRMKMYKSWTSNKAETPRIMEIFSPPRFSAMANIVGLQQTISFDLT